MSKCEHDWYGDRCQKCALTMQDFLRDEETMDSLRASIAALKAENGALKKEAMNQEWSIRALRRKLVKAVDFIRKVGDLKSWRDPDDALHAADDLTRVGNKPYQRPVPDDQHVLGRHYSPEMLEYILVGGKRKEIQ